MRPIVLLDDERLAEEFSAVALPALERCRESFFHESEAGVRLRCELHRCADADAPLVVFCHGYTESAVKLREMAYYFLQQGYSVLAYDQRGHGASTRFCDDPYVVHIDHFEDYVRDLISVTKAAKARCGATRVVLFGHSMGGGVSARALEVEPGLFDRCVLNAPMIQMSTGKFPVWMAKGMALFFLALGKGKKMCFLHKPYAPEDFAVSCATSRARFELYERIRDVTPELQTCAASYRWIREALRAHDRLMRRKNLARIETSLLIFRAGTDWSVRGDAMQQFANAVGMQIIDMPNAKHEVYRSPNADLLPYLETVFSFLE